MKGLILAGGEGTRLRPITHTGSKQLIPVGNKPVIQYALEDFRDGGITEVGVILGEKGRNDIQRFIGDGSEFGLDVTYIVQGEPLGLAHAVGCARDFVGSDDFVTYLGDNILKQGISLLMAGFQDGEFAAGIALQEVDRPEQFGVADLRSDGSVSRLVEKPDDPPSDLALIGVYLFSPVIFEAIEEIEPSWRDELEITDAIQWLLENDHLIDSHVIEGWWKDTGKPEDILEANRLVLDDRSCSVEGTIEDGAKVTGKADLEKGATVKRGATVRGPVSIAKGAVIEDGSYLGPYTSIGPDTTVDGAHIENSVVVGGSTISTRETIVDSLIGRGATIETAEDLRPEGSRLVIGERSNLKL